MKTKPNNDINLLTLQFKKKIELFLSECNKEWLYPIIYEWFRTKARQIELYNQWRTTPWKIITWTMKSKHLNWEAVDIVWKDSVTWNITWYWPYDRLIEISKQFWIDSLFPIETCHFQDNWNPLVIKTPTIMESKYTEVHNKVLEETWFKSLFDNFDNDIEIKELIDIALARYTERINKSNKV